MDDAPLGRVLPGFCQTKRLAETGWIVKGRLLTEVIQTVETGFDGLAMTVMLAINALPQLHSIAQ